MPVHIAQHYLYCGRDLKDLSVYDYMTLIEVKKITKKETEMKFGSGKYCFHNTHPLFNHYYQQLRQKYCIQKLIGKQPPVPGIKPNRNNEMKMAKWKKKADRFAAFWLTWFRPSLCYDGNVNLEEKFDWNAFVEFYSSLETNGTVISSYIKTTFLNTVKSFRVSTKVRELLYEYRFKEVSPWNVEEQKSLFLVCIQMPKINLLQSL